MTTLTFTGCSEYELIASVDGLALNASLEIVLRSRRVGKVEWEARQTLNIAIMQEGAVTYELMARALCRSDQISSLRVEDTALQACGINHLSTELGLRDVTIFLSGSQRSGIRLVVLMSDNQSVQYYRAAGMCAIADAQRFGRELLGELNQAELLSLPERKSDGGCP